MKKCLLFLVLFLTNQTFSQIEEGSITYQVDLIDEFTGLPLNLQYSEIDRQFEIYFNKNKARVYQQFTKETNTTYIYDKKTSEVLSLYQEFDKKYVDYSLAVGNSIKQLGHAYGDTVTTAFDETKKILGYTCIKLVLDMGDQVKATFWITNEINTGTILAESPLALNYPALEYTLEGGGTIEHFIATKIETTIENQKQFSEQIPDGYKLIVPIATYDQTGLFSDILNTDEEFDFIQYPEYPEGHEALYSLFKDLPAYISTEDDYLEGENGQPFYMGPNSIIIELIIDKEGFITERKVGLAPTEKIEKAARVIVEKIPNWIPAKIKGQPVASYLSVVIEIPVK